MAVRAGEVLAEGQDLFRRHAENMDDAIGQFSRRFQGIRQARQDTVLDDQAVDDDVDSVLFIFNPIRGILPWTYVFLIVSMLSNRPLHLL